MSTWNMPPGVSTNDIPGNEPDDCSTCGSGPCLAPQACFKSDEPPTRRELLCFWAGASGALAALATLIALALFA